MDKQNFKNHVRLVGGYHGVTFLLILSGLVASIVNLVKADEHTFLSAALFVLAFLALSGLFWYARVFALKAQDRAIRAEENFRHFILTGKPLDKQISLWQIIALRFASDEEMPSLAIRAVTEKLSQKEIKLAVKNWRADVHRV